MPAPYPHPEKILELWGEGHTCIQIGEALGISNSAVGRRLDSFGVTSEEKRVRGYKSRPRSPRKFDDEAILKTLLETKSPAKTAIIHNIGETTIYRILRRNDTDYQLRRAKATQYEVDKVIKIFLASNSIEQVEEAVSLTKNSIKKILTRNGVDWKEVIARQQQVDNNEFFINIVETYLDVKTIRKAAEIIGRTPRFIAAVLDYMKVERLPKPPSPSTKPSGSIRINTDGYILIKLPNHPCAMSGDWAAQHRAVYYDEYGPIPKGYIIHHINGIKNDNQLTNLIMLTRSEHHLFNHDLAEARVLIEREVTKRIEHELRKNAA
jgi:transposase